MHALAAKNIKAELKRAFPGQSFRVTSKSYSMGNHVHTAWTDGPTQAEIRVMYVWTDRLRPVLPLIRMGRGKMMGVDHNKGLRWVGASAGFLAPDA